MKKNVKIFGATAAALLAVAPVVASATTANAAMTWNQSQVTDTTNSQSTVNVNISANNNSGSNAGQVARTVSASSDRGHLTFSGANVMMNTNTAPMSDGQPLNAGNTYRIRLNDVKISGLTTGVTYNIDGGYFVTAGGKTLTSATAAQLEAGNLTFIGDSFFVTDHNAPEATAPYFYLRTDPTQQVIPDKTFAGIGTAGALGASNGVTNHKFKLGNLWSYLSGNSSPVVLSSNSSLTTTEANVRAQLTSAGINVASDGTFTIPANGFNITLTGVNTYGGGSTTVRLHFYDATRTNQSAYPVILQSGNKVAQTNGDTSTFTRPTLINVTQGESFNPISDGHITAVVSGSDSRPLSLSSLSTVVNNVNTNVPGLYNVTVRATNPAGLSTDFTYPVLVQAGDPNAAHSATIHYVPGYGINVWNLSGDHQSASFSGNRIQDGEKVTAYQTISVNGVSYTRVTNTDNPGDNNWVPTEYLSAHNSSNTNTNKPSNNNGEKAISGTARVTFNGKGSVKLLNANGRHVDQYVKKGSTWKVWAEKTVNGIHMYRIGNQNQWVPADYVTLN